MAATYEKSEKMVAKYFLKKLKRALTPYCPPIFITMLQKLFGMSITWHGHYCSWEKVQQQASGYDQHDIFQQVAGAALKVRNDQVAFERDGVLFDRIQYSWPLAFALTWIGSKEGYLGILDFGGGLGSSYFQNREFLGHFDYHWNIIEQPHFVAFGQQMMADGHLSFYASPSECVEQRPLNVLLLSSVLQYLEKPYEQLALLLDLPINYVILDRTPVGKNVADYLTLQTVPRSICASSYPCWIFGEKKLLDYFTNHFALVVDFAANDGQQPEFEFKGYLWQRIR